MTEGIPNLEELKETTEAAAKTQESSEDADFQKFQEIEAKSEGKFDEPKAVEPKAEEEQPKEPDDEEAPKVDRRTKEYRAAKQNLVLRGYETEEALKDMDPSLVMTKWSIMSERESDHERTKWELAEAKKKLGDLAVAKETESAESAVPAVHLDSSDLNDLFEELGIDADSKGAKALLATMEKATKPLRETLEAQAKVLQQQQERTLNQILQDNRTRLGEAYPRVKESEKAFETVANLANEMIADGTPEEAFDKAALELYGEASTNGHDVEAEEELKAKRKQRAAATPTTQTIKPPAKPLSKDEQDLAVFEHLRKNPGDKRGAQRVAGIGI